MTRKNRTAKTKTGKVVEIDTCREIDGGWLGYVIGPNGYAVAVFIPSK